ncbi:SusE domain-containing protein [uncultured Muribaculum sp.]|uniref:SusE domain-containing protein n=1 Tax=uncultured Muribaculum sp. TaxID=1918613 RepID=UPI0025E04875|nr:SusE domain-containing protein [uncultured Muribaculum sp.]
MKYISYIKAAAITAAALATASCTYDPYDTDIDPVHETMNLTCENPTVEIDENNLQAPAITFSWTPARSMPDDYMLNYKAELDVLGNSFGSKTVITSGVGFDYTYDDATGRYTATFTHEQLNNWYSDRWGLPVNKPFTLEFRVIADWTGGSEFETPEVRKVSAQVKPIQVIIFACDKMSVGGNAVAESTEINKTLENENVYAWKGTLSPGELQIPVEFDGVTYYLHNVDGSTAIADGTPMRVEMTETKSAWTVPAAGEYRIVINMTDKTATIYSEATDLQPLVVTFQANGDVKEPFVTIEVTDLYAFGSGTGWGVKTLGLVQSLADPQVFIFDGANNPLKTLAGPMKFCISKDFNCGKTEENHNPAHNQNNAYCFTCPLTADGGKQEVAAELNKVFYLHGGADSNTRNSYIKMPSETNFIIFDLRNNTLLAQKK